jgi:hypothetical protein
MSIVTLYNTLGNTEWKRRLANQYFYRKLPNKTVEP